MEFSLSIETINLHNQQYYILLDITIFNICAMFTYSLNLKHSLNVKQNSNSNKMESNSDLTSFVFGELSNLSRDVIDY